MIFTKTEVTGLQVVCLRGLGSTELRNAYKTLVWKSEDKRIFRKLICIFPYYLCMYLFIYLLTLFNDAVSVPSLNFSIGLEGMLVQAAVL